MFDDRAPQRIGAVIRSAMGLDASILSTPAHLRDGPTSYIAEPVVEERGDHGIVASGLAATLKPRLCNVEPSGASAAEAAMTLAAALRRSARAASRTSAV